VPWRQSTEKGDADGAMQRLIGMLATLIRLGRWYGSVGAKFQNLIWNLVSSGQEKRTQGKVY